MAMLAKHFQRCAWRSTKSTLSTITSKYWEWVSDCCLMPSEQFFSYIIARISCILVKWLSCPLCTYQHYFLSQTFITLCCIKYTLPWEGFKFTTLVVIGTATGCTGSCKSNYHTITTKTAPTTYGCFSKVRM